MKAFLLSGENTQVKRDGLNWLLSEGLYFWKICGTVALSAGRLHIILVLKF